MKLKYTVEFLYKKTTFGTSGHSQSGILPEGCWVKKNENRSNLDLASKAPSTGVVLLLGGPNSGILLYMGVIG